MPIHKPIRWFEGMFLRPHHFQQFELTLEAREAARGLLSDPHGWGVARLAVREDRLANYVIDVPSFAAVFPDGSIVDVPGNARLESRDFRAFMSEPGRALDVAVGLRERAPRAAQTGPGEGATGGRYLATEEEVYDLETGADPLTLQRLQASLRLFFDDEPTAGFETIPLLRLLRGPDPSRPVVLDEAFAPPSLRLAASPSLKRSAEATLARLDHVLRDLARARGTHDPRQMIMEQALLAARPVLGDIAADGAVHPRTAYREMARIAGSLLVRDESARSPEVVPAYDHRRPGPVFEALRQLIHELSTWAWEESYVRVPLVRVPDGDEFHAVLPPAARRPGCRLYIDAVAQESLGLLDRLLSSAKISTPARIPFLDKHALPGVRAEKQPGPPPELPAPQTGTFFRVLTETSKEWVEQVLAASDGALAVLLRGAGRDVTLSLVVVFAQVESRRG